MYLAKDFVSGTWQNILGSTASWVSNQNPEMRGFTLYIDGYDDSINDGRSVLHEGEYYYEWGYVFKDTDLDGIFEINSALENILDGKQPGEFVYENDIYYDQWLYVLEGGDELIGRYYCETASYDRPSDNGDWNRNPNRHNGDFDGDDLGIFEIDVALDFTGSAYDDEIVGSTLADTFKLLNGDDFVDAGAGSDIVKGGKGNDRIIGGYGNDRIFGGKHNDVIEAGVGNDKLNGGSGDDILYGGIGNDSLIGGTGVDSLYGGTGNDTYFVDNTSDTITENSSEGKDKIISSVTYTVSNNVENLKLVGSNNIDATGNLLANNLKGNNGNNTLNGEAGNDKITGRSGDDILYGGTGNDKLIGGNGDDVLYGGADTDKLYGGNGDDILYGGFGNDKLYGGPGNDIFQINSGDGRGVITDYTSGEDSIELLDGITESDLTFGFIGGHTRISDSEGDLLAIVQNTIADELTFI